MEKPILFNTVMVQAILQGKKTSTRRIIKNKYVNSNIEYFTNKYGTRLVYMQNDTETRVNKDGSKSTQLRACEEIKKPYSVGDTIWVRETWLKADDGYHYKSDETRVSKEIRELYGYKWKPSIHMSRVAARTFLKVSGIKAERLHDITENGAKAEGFNDVLPVFTAKELFQAEWNSIYKNWNENPWVWVIEFEKVENYEL